MNNEGIENVNAGADASVERLLESRGVRPTSNRLLVARALHAAGRAVSMADLEAEIGTLDKGSLFRTLTLFAEAGVVHALEDGSRAVKYELCHSEHAHTMSDEHPHFYCESCGRVECLHHLSVPSYELPEGYAARSANVMIKGLCPRCNK